MTFSDPFYPPFWYAPNEEVFSMERNLAPLLARLKFERLWTNPSIELHDWRASYSDLSNYSKIPRLGDIEIPKFSRPQAKSPSHGGFFRNFDTSFEFSWTKTALEPRQRFFLLVFCLCFELSKTKYLPPFPCERCFLFRHYFDYIRSMMRICYETRIRIFGQKWNFQFFLKPKACCLVTMSPSRRILL